MALSGLGKWGLPLRIRKRGEFFSDEGFCDLRKDFECAAAELLKELQISTDEDSFKSYRRVRDRYLSGNDRTAGLSEDESNYRIVMDLEGYANEDLQVRIVGPNHVTVEGKQKVSGSGSNFSRSFVRKFSLPGSPKLEDVTSELSSDNVLTVIIPKKPQAPKPTKMDDLEQELHRLQEALENLKTDSTGRPETSSADRFLRVPIARRDSFFQDAFFDEERLEFQKSVDQMMSRRLQRLDSLRDFDVFRKVRESQEDEVQALATSDGEDQYKITIDMHGFIPNDVTVTAIGMCSLIVEGRTKLSLSNQCSYSFQRKFELPSRANAQTATAALSEEGILAITVPKAQVVHKVAYESDVATGGKKESHLVSDRKEEAGKENLMPLVTESQETHDLNCSHSITEISESDSKETPVVVEHLETSIKYIMPQNHTCGGKILIDEPPKEEHIIPIDVEGVPGRPVEQFKEAVSTNKLSTFLEDKMSTNLDVKEDQTLSEIGRKVKNDPEIIRNIPLYVKGSLYRDSIFEEARKNFEILVEDAVNRFKNKSEKVTALSLSGHTPSTILEDERNYKIILDVFGYEEQELKVRTRGSDEISVEGFSIRKRNDSLSKHSFHRSFRIPEYVDLERASTALSSEGILTVAFPKKNQLMVKEYQKVIPIISQLEKEVENLRKSETHFVVDPFGIIREERRSTKSPELLVESKELVTESLGCVASEVQKTSHFSTRANLLHQVPEIDQTVPQVPKFQDLDKNPSQVPNLSEIDENFVQVPEFKEEDKSLAQVPDFSDVDKPLPLIPDFPHVSKQLLLPIVQRGNFFDDSFFSGSRHAFETALRESLSRFSRSSTFVDDLDFFQSLRRARISDCGNQLSAQSEDDTFFKIVLDVGGFDQKNLKIKSQENEITVEGEEEERIQNASCRKSFKKSFLLSGGVDLSRAISAISNDGVLNIKIPKTPLTP